MWIDYGVRIAETADELRARERVVRGQRAADRVKLLRLLKSGAARSVRQAAAMLGYSERQAQRWWGATPAAAWPPSWQWVSRAAVASGSRPRPGPT